METQKVNIKTFKDVEKIYKAIESKIDPISVELKQEITGLLELISSVSDGSGLIDACIEKYPNFVPHVRKIKQYVSLLDQCSRVLNDNEWLSSQDEFDDDSSSSSGGKGIIKIFDSVQYNLAVVNDLNLDIDCIFNMVYDLQHSQNKFYDKQKLQTLAKNYAKAKAQGKDKSQEAEEIRENIMGMSKARTMNNR